MDRYFQLLSGPAAAPRDWSAFRGLFLPTARMDIVAIDAAGRSQIHTQTVDEYVGHVDPWLTEHGFFQSDRDRQLACDGRIAQVFTRFESRAARDRAVIDRGPMAFQPEADAEGPWH